MSFVQYEPLRIMSTYLSACEGSQGRYIFLTTRMGTQLLINLPPFGALVFLTVPVAEHPVTVARPMNRSIASVSVFRSTVDQILLVFVRFLRSSRSLKSQFLFLALEFVRVIPCGDSQE